MSERLCKCGCGEPAGANWEYKRGHKPKSAPPPSNKLAKRERDIVNRLPDSDAVEEEETVTCEIGISKLDAIFQMLTPYQKAVAVLNGIGEVPPEV